MTKPMLNRLPAGLLAAALLLVNAPAGPADALEEQFRSPPASARPWVYWFPLSGNLTREGITADLEAMARVGIGGVLYMEVDQGTPKGPADFGGPLWRELFRHACQEAHRLGLEVNMNNDAGWCGSGGPWITPELSMQKVVWSETFVTGGARFEGALPRPPANRDYYQDIALLAFPTAPGDDVEMSHASPVFSSTGATRAAGRFTLAHPEQNKPQSVLVEFAQPFTARTLTATVSGRHALHGALEASTDGLQFKTVVRFAQRPPDLVLNFDATAARFFRLTLTRHDDRQQGGFDLSEIRLTPRYCLPNLLGKAAAVPYPLPPAPAEWPAASTGTVLPGDRVVDLTGKLDPAGNLSWDAPAGKWTLLRLGHTTTGKENHPAPEPGRGLECDKLSKAGAAAMFAGLMGKLIADNQPLAGRGKTLVATHIDSWEVGSQNWTPRLREEFRRLRGYDLWRYLPAFSGRVVDSMEITERFLWDLRQTVSDLLIENYAAEFRRLANQHGLRLSIEAYGEPADDLAYAGRADEPMAEFWAWGKFGAAQSCTTMASAAHTYGQRILGAEAFTATDAERWQGHPANVKDLGDWAFCEGINRFVFHRYAAQPWTNPPRAPGMSMGPWGLHYERTQTWWELSRPWHDYLSRCQFLLRQGLFVADVAYLQPEGAPRSFRAPPDAEIAPHIRGGHNFDGCAPEVVLTRMSVRNGRLVLPDGMSYRVLVLPPVETMTPRLLRKIVELSNAGATILADPKPPRKSPSLADLGAGDAEVSRLAAELWPKLITGKSPARFFGERGVPPDFSARPRLRHIHRTLDDAEIYFVANPEPHPVDAVATFRVAGRQPGFWWPDSGRIARATAFQERDGLTTLPLRLEPSGSVFVVFRKPAVPAQRLVSITRDGRELLPDLAPAAAGPPPDVSGTFTLAAWVNPETATALPREACSGISALRETHNHLLYPAPGHEVWSEGHAGMGLAVGRNGVCVLEHGSNHLPAVLVHPTALSGWTHVAVVYRDGTPSLYLGGKPVRTGLTSSLTVHGSVGVTHTRRPAPFQGGCGELQQFERALSGQEVSQLAQTPPPQATALRDPAFDPARCEIWHSGAYILKTADGRQRELQVSLPAPQEIAGPWQVSFDPARGGPAQATFDALADWSRRAEPGIRFYSGTAIYRTRFPAGEPQRQAHRLFLDLGAVAVMASVTLNGKSLGVLWKPPYRVEVTGMLSAEGNQLEVEVANLWINRQIGDEQLPEDSDRNAGGTLKSWPEWLAEGRPSPTGRLSFTTHRLWKKDDPLVESGLLGPVTLRAACQP